MYFIYIFNTYWDKIGLFEGPDSSLGFPLDSSFIV